MDKKFTLVELLVVIAILGVLITLLVPSIQKSREAGKSAVCKSNERQYGILLTGYIYEKNENTRPNSWAINNLKVSGQMPYYRFWEFFALGSSWEESLAFVQQTHCPLTELPMNIDDQNPYSISRHIQKQFLAEIDSPVETIWLGEKPTDRSIPISVRFNETTDDRHQLNRLQSNVLLVDGHVESGYYLEYVDMVSGPHF